MIAHYAPLVAGLYLATVTMWIDLDDNPTLASRVAFRLVPAILAVLLVAPYVAKVIG